MKCRICKSDLKSKKINNCQDYEYKYPGSFYFHICRTCSTCTLNPFQSDSKLSSYYPDDYHSYNTESNFILKVLYRITYFLRFRKYYSLLKPNKNRILDIGCADGKYFDYLNKNINITGIEFNDQISQEGRIKGRNIFTGTLKDLPKGEKYDLVIMNNLIEHVNDPITLLQEALSFLEPEGCIFIETPNFRCLDFKIWGSYWGGLHTPRHTFIFSEESFHYLKSKLNIKITQVNYILNTGHWALSIQNYIESLDMKNSNLYFGRSWYYKYLLLILIPVNFLQKLVHRTGSMEITIQKS